MTTPAFVNRDFPDTNRAGLLLAGSGGQSRGVLARVLNVFFSFVLILMAGCAGGGRKVTPLQRERGVVTEKAEVTKPQAVVQPEAEVKQPAPVVKPEVAIETGLMAVAPRTNWVSLSEWCRSNSVAGPDIKISATETNVEIKGEAGVFRFEPPRRNARWNGVLIGVGFAPVLTNGAVLVNELDLEKMVRPLMFRPAGERKENGVLAIDAGHGGENFGTLSFDRKLREKDLTLDWAKRVQKLLEGSKWKVLMTRQSDLDVGLTQRVAFAEMKKADLFVSLHFNSAGGGSLDVAGLETYCFTPQGMASHLTRDYADDVWIAFGNNRFDLENLVLANDLHRAILKRTGRGDRGVKRARFMTVLREQQRPAVLIEGGYLSNPEEARLIATPEYRQKLAEAVVEGLGIAVKPPTQQ